VTLVTAGQSGLGKVRAVSGVPSINDRAEVIRSLQQLANEVLRTGQPVLRQLSRSNAAEGELSTEISSDGSFQNLICTRFSTGGNGSPGSAPAAAAARGPSRVGAPSPAANSALVIEYRNYDELVVGATHLPLLLPSLSMAWEQQSRLLHIPRFVRTLGTLATTPGRLARPALGWLALAGVLIVVGWLLLRPSPLVIEALGNVEPAISRAVFASADGFVENLVVRDGDRVKQGEILIRIRSPELEIKIQGAQGELNALEKEASGLRIALNQLDPDSPDVLSHQSQLASKVAEIDTRRQNLIRQIELLNHEKSLLALTSPIDGTVVAKDIEQRLERRPVRRGEPLLDIVDLDGPWQIRVHVADHDSGYVLDHYAASHASERSDPEETASNVVRYVIDSAPEYSLSARVSWIADQVENLHGEGSFVEVRATLDKQFPQLESNHDDVHMGAGVHAYFDCGQQPVWFVWFRPLIEAAQRRMWFRSHEHE
jgi:multidrug efflux pump subunit AcrA (membrane-fusion protein)